MIEACSRASGDPEQANQKIRCITRTAKGALDALYPYRTVAGELGFSPATDFSNEINNGALNWRSALDRLLYESVWTG